MNGASPIVEMTGISLSFPGVKALDAVDFRLFPGEVHSIVGENGAGKSTLIKILTGVYRPESGEIRLSGTAHTFANPARALEAGISTVYQEVNLLENLSVAENIMLGREPRWWGGIDWPATKRRAAELLAGLNLDIDPSSELGTHSLAIQQLVAICRAISVEAKILVLDEPTSSLDADEVAELFRVIRRLKSDGVAIVFISHFLDQVYELSDRLTVLRNGELVGEYMTEDILRIELVHKMLGKEQSEISAVGRKLRATLEDEDLIPLLEADGIGRQNALAPTNLKVYDGEVIGLAGLLGSGRTELSRLLAGADRADRGSLRFRGRPVVLRTPHKALAHRIVYASENRRSEGIIDELTVRENIVLALQADRGWLRPISRRRQEELVASYIQALNIRPGDPETLAGNLSGGNQQRVLIARWLAIAPLLLILDEPTRGIDVGAKAEIQRLVIELAENGMSVIYVSAELDEVLRLADRVVVMRDRERISDVENDGVTFAQVMALIASGEES
jgi:simple sugar transport system ATP-binding protein